MQQPAIAAHASQAIGQLMPEDRTGQVAGRYRFLNLIGEGGMGEVYRAEDTELSRPVAIKLIRSALKTKEILRRFDNERQILAQLNHDHIARLFDAGTTDDGVPFLVMEYVAGQPIDDYCRRQTIHLDERLNLFRNVCAAVQYAHQHLIVHRDLKPSNVLVTNEGKVKLLDFGIAKLLDAATETDATATLWRVMTPEYASPEQVKGAPVTTATDVYALGVMLYELLTDALPYRISKRTTDEIIKAICEQEPPKPSQAVADLGLWNADSNADDPSQVNRQSTIWNPKLLKGDLDNIILKALRKEPARRYQSVAEFSDDIRRYLHGLPVSARTDTFGYRAAKFIKRNRLAVVAAAALVLVLLAGGVTTAWEAHKARVEKAIADERFSEVRQIAHQVMFDYHDAIATLPGSTPVRERMVKDSLTYLDKLSEQVGGDRGLRREIGSAYFKIGDVQGRPFHANLGDSAGAMESYRKSLLIRQELAALDPHNVELSTELAASYERIGQLNTAMGKPSVALEDLRKAQAIYQDLLRSDPTNRPIRGELGLINMAMGIAVGFSATNSLGDTKAAIDYQQKGIAILEPLVAEEPGNLTYREYLAGVHDFLASLAGDSGNLPESLNNYRQALAIDESMIRDFPADNYVERERAVDLSNVCNVMRNMGDYAGSLENCRDALAIFEKMATADPSDANIAKDLAIMHQNLGVTLTRIKNYVQASEHYRTSVRILEDLAAKNAADAELQMRKAWAYYRLSDVQTLSGEIEHAIENAEHAQSILEPLTSANPNNSTAAKYLAVVYSQSGKCYASQATAHNISHSQRTDYWHEARDWYQKSLAIWQELKSKGKLSGVDEKKPDEVTDEIQKCDEVLTKLPARSH